MIPPLHSLSLWKRIVLAIVILVVAILLLMLISWWVNEPAAAEDVPHSKWDDHLLELDKQAIDEAYVEQIKQLFSGWMKDTTGQPARAVAGARRAQNAYIGAQMEIEKREPNKYKSEP